MRVYNQKADGFTLIELLAVLVIVGLAASFTFISLGKGFRSENLDVFSKQFRNTLGFAAEEAVLFRRQIGVVFDVETLDDENRFSYRFLTLDEDRQRWFDVEDKDLKKALFPSNIELSIEIDDEELVIGGKKENDVLDTKNLGKNKRKTPEGSDDEKDKEKDKEKEKGEKLYPDIVFFSSGETQKFVIKIASLNSPENVYEISANILGQITLKKPGSQDGE